MTAYPEVVSADRWQQQRDDLLVAEKEATRAQDALAARRRRLPMVAFRPDYVFAGPSGETTLLGLFGGHEQLAVYQFMDLGPDRLCGGCTSFTDNVTDLTALSETGVAWATASDMPLPQIEGAVREHGWGAIPFYSSRGNGFSADCGAGGGFLLSLFLRRGDEVFRTYSTTSRGVDRLRFSAGVADLAARGRQEEWEDSPAGWPQHPTYG